MAFNTNPAAAAANTSGATNDNWKAQGFINLYLPSKDGKRRKLGAIPLRDSKNNEKSLREWLEADPANMAKVMAKLIMEYQSATPQDTSSFDLG